MTERITTILLTGAPGVGKTTLVRKICEELNHTNVVDCNGFYTEEVRAQGKRIGFDVVTLDGKRNILARETPTDELRRPKVGKYSVYTNEFESLALPLVIAASTSGQLLVLDEIGKMELLSHRFGSAITTKLDDKNAFILATIPLQTRQVMPIVECLRKANTSRLFEITKANRNQIQTQIMLCIKEKIVQIK